MPSVVSAVRFIAGDSGLESVVLVDSNYTPEPFFGLIVVSNGLSTLSGTMSAVKSNTESIWLVVLRTTATPCFAIALIHSDGEERRVAVNDFRRLLLLFCGLII